MDDLSALAIHHGTDKGPHWTYHGYTERYGGILGPMRHEIGRVLEIGVYQGASLRMWRDYFPNAEIHGIDIEDCREMMCGEERITVHLGDAANKEMLSWLALREYDVIIDDGSHNLADMEVAFRHLWPVCARIYVIEDVLAEFGDELRRRIVARREPEVLISRTTPERSAWIFDARLAGRPARREQDR